MYEKVQPLFVTVKGGGQSIKGVLSGSQNAYLDRGLTYDLGLGEYQLTIEDYRKALDIGGISDSLRQEVEQRLWELE